jgi:outer membrane receptor protein involved in Fe transport
MLVHTEVSGLEKLKSKGALLYGNVAPGGILNMVTKTSFKERRRNFNANGQLLF